VGAWVLGLGLAGGFLSAMGCLALTGAALVLGMRVMRTYDNFGLIVLTINLYLVVASWTFLFVVPAAALILGFGSGVRHMLANRHGARFSREVIVTRIVLAASGVGLLGVVGILFSNDSTLVSQLKTPGGIIVTGPDLFLWIGAAVLIAFAMSPDRQQRIVRLVPLGVYVADAVTVVWIRSFHPAGVDWTYYATKMIWLATATLLWVPFIILVDVVRLTNELIAKVGPRRMASAALSVAGSTVLLWGIGHETPFPFPWTWAFVGSTIPSPQELQLVTHEANIGGPFVIWQISTPYEDQLGNFWSALTWDYNANGTVKQTNAKMSFVVWAAWENGSLASLCRAVTDDRLRVVTTNSRLVPTLRLKCPGYRPVRSQANEH
jgi:hypothetical protein